MEWQLMVMRKRLERLERQVADLGAKQKCTYCRAWPWVHTVSMTAGERLAGKEVESPARCPRCGRSPMLIVEIIVASPADVAALQKLKEAEKTA
jgi:hypothetical protein